MFIYTTDQLTKVKAFTLLGEINLRKKNYKVALEYFKRGLQIPQIPTELKDRSYLGMGVSNFFVKNNIDALKNLNSIDEKTTNVEKDKLNFYKGESNFFLGNFNDAISNYNKVTSSDNLLQKNTIYGKAYSYFNLRDFQKAAYFFNEFINNENEKSILETEAVLYQNTPNPFTETTKIKYFIHL